jgi:hypothetical protein
VLISLSLSLSKSILQKGPGYRKNGHMEVQEKKVGHMKVQEKKKKKGKRKDSHVHKRVKIERERIMQMELQQIIW